MRKLASKIMKIALIFLMTSVAIQATSTVKAQTYKNVQEGGSVPLPSGITPDLTVTTTAYLSFTPNPVGLGQKFLVNLWITPPSHSTRYFKDYTVTITKPDGTKDVIKVDSYRGDTTSWFEYTADQIGAWRLKFDFLGGYFPAGNYTQYAGGFNVAGVFNFAQSCYYQPSSTMEQNLTVQKDIIDLSVN